MCIKQSDNFFLWQKGPNDIRKTSKHNYMMKRSTLFLSLTLFLGFIFNLQAQDTNNDGYHDGDVAALNKILSDNSGNTLAWDDEEYDTWSGLIWSSDTPVRLTGIDISSTRLSGTLDLSACAELSSITCSSNNIDSLILGNLSSLTELYCSKNNLKHLDVSGLEALTTLECNSNNLTCLYLSNNENLTAVNANYNNLQFINCKNGNSSNLSLNTNIRYGNLYCIKVDDVDTFPNKSYPDEIYSTSWAFEGVNLPLINYESIVDINSEEAVTELTTPTLLGENTDLVTITNDATFPISDIGLTVVTWSFDFGNGFIKTAKQYIVVNNTSLS